MCPRVTRFCQGSDRVATSACAFWAKRDRYGSCGGSNVLSDKSTKMECLSSFAPFENDNRIGHGGFAQTTPMPAGLVRELGARRLGAAGVNVEIWLRARAIEGDPGDKEWFDQVRREAEDAQGEVCSKLQPPPLQRRRGPGRTTFGRQNSLRGPEAPARFKTQALREPRAEPGDSKETPHAPRHRFGLIRSYPACHIDLVCCLSAGTFLHTLGDVFKHVELTCIFFRTCVIFPVVKSTFVAKLRSLSSP